MSTITVTDTTTASAVTVDSHDVVDVIRGWYPDAPAEVTGWIEQLQTCLDRGEYTGELEDALGIRIEAR